MNPRVNYEMMEADFEKILNACKPTPVMYLSGGTPLGSSPQENANHAWEELGKRMGFDYMTVRPDGRGKLFFTAVPTDTPAQCQEREDRERLDAKRAEVSRLEREVKLAQDRLAELLKP